jgi:hypothetical protein
MVSFEAFLEPIFKLEKTQSRSRVSVNRPVLEERIFYRVLSTFSFVMAINGPSMA